MRQILSTAIVTVIVSMLTLTVAGALAQSDPERAVAPAARVSNADKVDGRDAIGYTNKRGVRRGKLVATNKLGELPSNIVRPYWGFIKNKPGILADHQISWNEVIGTPAGFADGVDNKGVAGLRLTTVVDSVSIAADGQPAGTRVDCPTEQWSLVAASSSRSTPASRSRRGLRSTPILGTWKPSRAAPPPSPLPPTRSA